MAVVKVSQETKGEPDKIFKKVRNYCDKELVLKEVGNLKPEVKWDAQNWTGTFHEKGVRGTISVSGKSETTITIEMEIPFFLLPFKRVLTESVQKHLEKFA